MQIHHLGAENTVTGSCHLICCREVNILVDCGSVFGSDTSVPIEEWPKAPKDIDFLFLTHAHIDHIGRVPELIASGFSGEIICSHATAALLVPMLEDALGFSDTPEQEKQQMIDKIQKLCWGFEYGRRFDLIKGIRFKLGCAGHILGSCWVLLELPDGYTVVFSGDIGSKNTPVLPDPDVPDHCDLLVMESTYGDRCHEDRTRRIDNLNRILNHALSDRGKVLIPAFALGRIQELIYELDRLYSDAHRQKLYENVPVFIDSPLGLEITRLYSNLHEFWDQEARSLLKRGDHPLDFTGLIAVADATSHHRLIQYQGPAIIIAGSGMCTGGRIVDHLKKGLSEPSTDILFVGYQAKGTLGHDIVKYYQTRNGYVVLNGCRCHIHAAVYCLTGYSAHADQKELMQWATSIQPGQIKLVHGTRVSQTVLAAKLSKKGLNVAS